MENFCNALRANLNDVSVHAKEFRGKVYVHKKAVLCAILSIKLRYKSDFGKKLSCLICSAFYCYENSKRLILRVKFLSYIRLYFRLG